MKRTTLFFLAVTFVFTTVNTFAQGKLDNILDKSVPNVTIKNINDETVYTGELKNDGKPIIISFWATWCTPCKKELNTIHDMYIDWQDETGVRLIAVSIDDQRTASRVVPYVDAQSWDYEILLDPNSDFRRAMGVTNIPHTFLIDGNGNIVSSHNNYAPGDEYELYDEILKLTEEK